MAHTDKTNPTWVKINQNLNLTSERHDHRDGICDLRPLDRPIRWKSWRNVPRCYYHVSYYGNYLGYFFYGRSSRIEQRYRREENRRARTEVRNILTEIAKLSRDDMIDVDYPSTKHYRLSLCEMD